MDENFLFTFGELESITRGTWVGVSEPDKIARGINQVCTDTRKLIAGDLYLALHGERYDGHQFIADARSKGAAAACVSQIDGAVDQLLKIWKIPVLLVENTLRAYQLLAKKHRLRFNHIPVIAVTGSSGKTTTKDIIHCLHQNHYLDHTLATIGNTNNQIGVPFNILRLNLQHSMAILELGTNSPGEINQLVTIVNPTIAVLTNIGPVHLQGLKDLEGVLKEKSEIFSTISENCGVAVLPYRFHNHPYLTEKLRNKKVITFGFEQDADVRVVYNGGNIHSSQFKVQIKEIGQDFEVIWPLSGAHLTLNAAAGIAVAYHLGMAPKEISNALSKFQLSAMRMEVRNSEQICWINDAYNANPDSMRAFLDWIREITLQDEMNGDFYIVLGDMFELGQGEEMYHHNILSYALDKLPQSIILPAGKRMMKAAKHFSLKSFENALDVKKWLELRLKKGDLVALKGSRAMGLEKILSE